MKGMIFYRCPYCGNLIYMVEDSGVAPVCCGEEMEPVEVNHTEASFEKHIPMLLSKGFHWTVTVGETLHPMKREHFIQWIALLTDRSCYVRRLVPGDEPVAAFDIRPGEEVIAAFAYCNLHGLWRGSGN